MAMLLCCSTVSRLVTLPSGTGMAFNFSDILSRPRHKRHAQSKNNVFAFVEYMDTNAIKKLKSRDDANK